MHQFVYAPYGTATTPDQNLNGMLAPDPHLEPVPEAVRLIRPGLPTRVIHIRNADEPENLRLRAADFAVRRSAEMLGHLADQDWLATMSLPARRWVVKIGRSNPQGMGRLLGELAESGWSVSDFFARVAEPHRKAALAELSRQLRQEVPAGAGLGEHL